MDQELIEKFIEVTGKQYTNLITYQRLRNLFPFCTETCYLKNW